MPESQSQIQKTSNKKTLLVFGVGGMIVLGAVAILVAFFLKGQSGVSTPSDPFIAKGQVLYNQNCSECHGERARGDGPKASTLQFKPADLVAHRGHHGDQDFFTVIKDGTGFVMPSFKDKLNEEQMRQIVAYIRFLKE